MKNSAQSGSFSPVDYILFLLTLFGSLSLTFYIFLTFPVVFNADSFAFIGLAKEQRETLSFFPEKWCYSTGLMIVTPSLFIHFFSPFFEYSLLSRSFSVFLFVLLLFLTVILLFANEKKKTGVLFTLTLLTSGVSPLFAEYLYGQAAYSNIWITIIPVLLTINLLKLKQEARRLHLPALLIISAGVFLSSFSGLSKPVQLIIPFIVTLVIWYLTDLRSSGDQKKKHGKAVSLILTWILSTLAGLIYFKLFANLEEAELGNKLVFAGFEDWVNNMRIFKDGILHLFNYIIVYPSKEFAIFSDALYEYRVVMFLFLMIAPSVLMMIEWKKIRNIFFKLFVLYYVIHFFTLFFSFILSGVAVNQESVRYFTSTVVLSFIVFGIFVNHYLIHRPVQLMLLLALLLPLILSSAMYINAPYIKIEIIDRKAHFYSRRHNYSWITDFLKSNKLKFGYSHYWHSGIITSLSNWTVHVNPVHFDAFGLPAPNYWLTSKRWFDPSYYRGETFLIVADDENVQHNHLNYYAGPASRTLKYEGFTVLVYDYNIAERLPRWSFYPKKE